MTQQEAIEAKIYSYNEFLGGHDKTVEYAFKVFDWLVKIPAREIFTVADLVKTENTELFTEIVKLYIYSIDQSISFLRNDFKQFRKNEPINYKK